MEKTIRQGFEPKVRLVDLVAATAVAVSVASLELAPDATPSIPPLSALVWVLVALAGATLFCRRPSLHLAAAVLVAGAAEHLTLTAGQPLGHDLHSHSWGIWAFFQAMHDGDPTPVWLHDVGLGLPLMVFYAPAAYYSLTPLYWAGLSAAEILDSAFLCHTIVGTVSLYFLARRWTGCSGAGLVAATAYAFAPYRLLDAHYRLALAESGALALFPLLFGLAFDPGRWSRRRLAATGLAAAAVLLMHPLSVLTAGVAALVWHLAEGRGDGHEARGPRRLGGRLGAAVLGLAVAGFYVVPMIHRLDTVSLDLAVRDPQTGELRLAQHGLRPSQPFLRLPWKGVLLSEARGSPRDADGEEMPVYVGWGIVGCALLAGAIGLRRRRRRSEGGPAILELPVAAVGLVTLGLSFQASAEVLARLPWIPALQFSWRFLGPASLAGALAAGYVARFLIAARRGVWAAALLGLLVADGLPYAGAGAWIPDYQGLGHFYREPGPDQPWRVESIVDPPPIRVFGSFMPPTEFGVPVAHVRPGFAEYFNARALELVLAAPREKRLDELGVRWIAEMNRPERIVLDAAPFAQWRAAGPPIAGATAVRPLEFRRREGIIEVELPNERGQLLLLEQYDPGWEATLDGAKATVAASREGLIEIAAEPGARLLRLRYRLRGADIVAGRAFTAIALVLVAILALAPPHKRWT